MRGRSRFEAALTGASLAAALAMPVHAAARLDTWRFRAEHVLGTSLDFAATAPDRASARIAADAALAEIGRLDAVLSGWRADSELARLNEVSTFAASPDLFAVLAACEDWRRASGGAFDARQGAAFEAQRRGDDIAALWTDAEPQLDPAAHTIIRPDEVRFAPEALAKGYIVDRALAAARAAAPDIAGMMLDIGGDLRCWGRGPDAGGWTVGLAAPLSADNAAPTVLLRPGDRALATSGRRDEVFHHILGGDAVLQASVVAPTAMQADALATALCAMSPTAGLALAGATPGVEARIIGADGRIATTKGWSRLTLAQAEPPARLIRTADVATTPWPVGFVATVDYEIPRQHGRAYAPYVAIWITDENARLVRGLTMLGPKLDYVSENFIWWRRYGRSHPQIVAAISRPTKKAGRYTAVWDGKDDLGQPVGQGKYAIHIEATREDGLHSYQSMEITLGADPAQASAAAGDELGPSMVRYGKR